LTAKPLQTKTTITSGIQIVIKKIQSVLVQELEKVRQLEESEYKKNEKTEQISCHKEYFVKAKTDCSRYQNPVHSFTKNWEDTFCMRFAKDIKQKMYGILLRSLLLRQQPVSYFNLFDAPHHQHVINPTILQASSMDHSLQYPSGKHNYLLALSFNQVKGFLSGAPNLCRSLYYSTILLG
jgi:hypothetical protein